MTQDNLTPRRVVDSREPWIIREKLLQTGWEQATLYSGDFRFFSHDYEKVGVTRKKVIDLLSSIGEVFSKQLEEMLSFYTLNIILLEGSWSMVNPHSSHAQLTTRGLQYHTWSMVWNYLRRWFDKGFTLEITVDEGHTVQRLNELYSLYQKPFSLSARTRKFSDDRILALPSGLRGEKSGKVLFNGSTSIADLCTMSESQFKDLDGIGDKKATSLFTHLHRR